MPLNTRGWDDEVACSGIVLEQFSNELALSGIAQGGFS
jgi:hypothetical protein